MRERCAHAAADGRGPKTVASSVAGHAGHQQANRGRDRGLWQYPTLWSYVRRAQPYDRPGSLTPDQVYAVTAYLLHRNGIVGEQDVMDATTLPRIAQMPNRNGFVPDTTARCRADGEMTGREAKTKAARARAWRAQDAWSPGPPTEPHVPNDGRTTRWRMSVPIRAEHPRHANACARLAACTISQSTKRPFCDWRSSAGRIWPRVYPARPCLFW